MSDTNCDALDEVLTEYTEDADLRYERERRRADEYPANRQWPKTVRCHGCGERFSITFDEWFNQPWKVEACSVECRRYLDRLDAIEDYERAAAREMREHYR